MYTKVFAVFDRVESMATVRALEFERGISADKEKELGDLAKLFLNNGKKVEYNVNHSNDLPFVFC